MARKLKTKEDLVFTFCGTPEYLSPEMLMHKGRASPDDPHFRPMYITEMNRPESPGKDMDKSVIFG